MKIIGMLPYDCTVQELIDLLAQLPGDATITPFGESDCAVCYDKKQNLAYLDSTEFFEEEFDIEF